MDTDSPSTERRLRTDRRVRPTTLWSTLRWRGRRHGFRRAGEAHRVYVDHLSRRTVMLALLCMGGSVLDALLTLLHLAEGASEANLAMHLALTHSAALFLALKLSITGVSAWWLAAHQHLPLAQRGLYGLALGYGVVLGYQLLLFWGSP
jgi:hypothetical protein